MNETETMKVTYPGKDVEDIIKVYFGDALKSLDVTMIGRLASARISYEDFKPKRKVRRELEDKIPNIEIAELERMYSKKAMFNMLEELMEDETDIYIKESNGAIRPTNISMLFEEKMYHRNYAG